MALETVKWFNFDRGSGFIAVDDSKGEDVFVHYESINIPGSRTLNENQRVEFEIVQGSKGMQADHAHPPRSCLSGRPRARMSHTTSEGEAQ